MNTLSQKLLVAFSILGGTMTHAFAQKSQQAQSTQPQEQLIFFSESTSGYYATTMYKAADRQHIKTYNFNKNKQIICVEDDISFANGHTLHRTSCVIDDVLNIGTVQKIDGRIITQHQSSPIDGTFKLTPVPRVVDGMMTAY